MRFTVSSRDPARERVLLVVEEPLLGETLLGELRSVGKAAERCSEWHHLRQRLRARRFDAVIVDFDRLARDGMAFLAMARAEAPAAWILALLPPIPTPDSSMGYDAVLLKPASLEAILAALAARSR